MIFKVFKLKLYSLYVFKKSCNALISLFSLVMPCKISFQLLSAPVNISELHCQNSVILEILSLKINIKEGFLVLVVLFIYFILFRYKQTLQSYGSITLENKASGEKSPIMLLVTVLFYSAAFSSLFLYLSSWKKINEQQKKLDSNCHGDMSAHFPPCPPTSISNVLSA